MLHLKMLRSFFEIVSKALWQADNPVLLRSSGLAKILCSGTWLRQSLMKAYRIGLLRRRSFGAGNYYSGAS